LVEAQARRCCTERANINGERVVKSRKFVARVRTEENLLSLFFSVFPPERRFEGRQGCGPIVGSSANRK